MKINVAVIFGGVSVEHEISVISALQTIHAFDKSKYDITPVYITKQGKWLTGSQLLEVDNYKDLPALEKNCDSISLSPHADTFVIFKQKTGFGKQKILAKIDVVFPVLHGKNGEDGAMQGFLSLKNIPFVGSHLLGSVIGIDKVAMKLLFKSSGIPTVDFVWFYDKDWYQNADSYIQKIEAIGYPVIIKPSDQGSSVGISTAKNREELRKAIDLASSFSGRILVEKMIANLQEINCSVLGDSEEQQASVCEEPLSSGEILSYTDKYVTKSGGSKGMQSTKRRIPADIPDALTQEIQDLARQSFKVIDASGVARIDFLIDKDTQKLYVNEINTIPGSLSFYLWEASGKSFKQLVDELVKIALKRQRDKSHYLFSYDANIFKMSGSSMKLGKS